LEERIYQLRKRAELSQEELAEVVGVSRQAVQKWESGSASPDIANLAALCEYFGVTMDYLVRGLNTQERERETPAPEPEGGDIRDRYPTYEYVSKTRILGLPLVHIRMGIGFHRAKGIIAIGNVATGVIAIGGLSLGVFSLGGAVLGVFALGGLALGARAFGGVAVSLFLSCGGLAVSCGYALGGVAVAVKGAFGGVAVASEIAVGSVAYGGLALKIDTMHTMGTAEIEALIRAAYPDVREWVLRLARLLARAG